MSVWATTLSMDNAWPDDLPPPIAYRRSHVIPARDDDRAGHLDLASIPAFVTRDGRDDGAEEGTCWPFLRLSMRGSDEEPDTVVLDVDQVEALYHELGEWLSHVNRDLT